ncbi:GGDEF domain-containing protein [Kineosporia succinea]|uniref:Diguanylate cyclase (GGDEF)-like protein n=1 Tax=Kineosporia succinea TaxID=84632 RepID=A0ABT9PEW2_9ACTN|nr:GGDEF domain-containing protein [Kineosporia succinea]MDP9831250.1 diguanylate cyclase (GGDEF)-like protein [Kineosporia succinea]
MRDRALLAVRLADLDDLVGSDPSRARHVAFELEQLARRLDDSLSVATALIWQAEAAGREGHQSIAAQLVNTSREHGPLPPELVVRGAWVMARVYNDFGDQATALDRIMDAVAAFGPDVTRRLRTRVMLTGADLLDDLGDREDSLLWYGRAEELADGDAHMQIMVANNRAYSSLTAGDLDDAQAQARLLAELSTRHKRPLNAGVLDTIANVHLLRGDYRAALETAHQAVDVTDRMDTKVSDARPEHLLTLGIAQRLLGLPEQAAESLARARAACGPEGHGRVKVRILEQEAELLAGRGEWEAAFHRYREFHTADQELLSAQREAAARSRQAVFETGQAREETDRAREEAARYREEARRDPLTGLRNRLYVEEHLGPLIESSHTLGVALIDLDHFKSVNDTYSHEVGDEVLRVVARVLDACLAEATHASSGSSFAARLGGEELLVVMADAARGAREVAELCRAAVEGQDWSRLTPGRVITLSAGVAVAEPGDNRATLLSRADAQLYEAKAVGRNRVR